MSVSGLEIWFDAGPGPAKLVEPRREPEEPGGPYGVSVGSAGLPPACLGLTGALGILPGAPSTVENSPARARVFKIGAIAAK